METRSWAAFSREEGRQSTSSKTLHAVLPGSFLWQALGQGEDEWAILRFDEGAERNCTCHWNQEKTQSTFIQMQQDCGLQETVATSEIAAPVIFG